MNNIILIIPLLIIVLTLTKPKWGLSIMLCCYLLLPAIPIEISGVQFKKNHVLILVVTLFFVKQILIDSRRITYTPFMFCIIYLFFSAIFIPFKEMGSSIQLYYIFYDIIIALFFPIAIWNVFLHSNCVILYRKALLCCIFVSGLYGIFLLFTEGFNPWISFFSLLEGGDDSIWTHYYSNESRLFGRISSVFFHPMHYAAFIGFAVIYLVYIRNKVTFKWFLLVFSILCVNLVTCGVRSVLGALIITILVFILLKRKLDITLTIIFVISIVVAIAMSIPGLDTYLSSIFSKPENSTVGGSSLEMRLDQLEGALEEINNNPLMGKGYGWCRDYILQNEGHPVLLGFESIILVVLCNNGIIGLFLYALFGILYYLYVKRHATKNNRPFFICLLIYYYAYECITGEFAFQFFMLFYTFMLCENYCTYKLPNTKLSR